VGLPAFLLSKNLIIRVYRNALIASGRVWWDLPDRFGRSCLPALPQFLGFCFGVLVALRLCFEIPCGELLPLVTAPKHCRKIKNPASSAGRNHSHLSGSTRCSTSFYPVLVKNPTIGSTSCLRFFSEDFFDPTVMPLSSPWPLRALEPSVMIPAFLSSSSPGNNYFWLSLTRLWISPGCFGQSPPAAWTPGRG